MEKVRYKLDEHMWARRKKGEEGARDVHQFHRDIRNFKSKLSIQTKLSSASALCDMTPTTCIVSHRSRKRTHLAYPAGKKESECVTEVLSVCLDTISLSQKAL